ncbi:protein unc-80 homolog [Clonorchis sinensis]|uniref:Protein unc-80 homolog n=1 Tax=Clonorchis sinensis TaxID=79923 RepID=G7Y6B6_CLOSI|nr:protein unc-80 homolog [Clonorchis sinensis]
MLREKLRHQLPTSKHMRSNVILNETGGRGQLQFSQYETKLLYTLHWILLDAAAECEDAELEGTSNRANRTTKYGFLHDLSSIQLFIYLFAPIIEQLQASDFETLKLEAGLAIWVPLMAFQQPARGTLPTPVKLFDLDHGMFGRVLPALDRPRQVGEDIEEVAEVKTAEKIVGGIYVGEGKKPKHVGTSLKEQAKAIDIGAILLHFDRTVPDVDEVEPVSTESVKQKKPVIPPIILTQIYPTGKAAPPKALAECMDDDEDSGTHEPGQSTPSQTSSHQSDHLPPGYPRIEWMLSHETENVLHALSVPDSEENTYHSYGSTCLLATHCDVAVIRCLFCAEWCEAGVYWSLNYLFKRLLQIRSARQKMEQETRKILRLIRDNATWRQYGDLYGGIRSTSEALVLGMRSLSMPDLSVLCTFPTHSSPSKHSDSGQDRRSRDHADSNQRELKVTSKDILLDSESGTVDRPSFQSKHLKTRPFGESSEPGHDKKIGNRSERTNIPGDLKNLPDEFGLKVPATLVSDASLSLALPLVGSGGSRLALGLSSGHQTSWKNSKRSRIADIKERFTRASKFKGTDQLLKSGDTPDTDTNDLRDGAPETQKRLEVPHVGHGSSSTLVTIRSQHSFDALQVETESDAGKRASVYKTGTRDSPQSPEKKVTWTEEDDLKASSVSLISRSFTDSDIIYHTTEKVDEVPGAVHYISVNGQLDYSVVLRALYWVSTEHKSTRVCVQLLRCLCTLFEMDIMDHASKQKPPQFKPRKPVSLHSKWKKFKISPRMSTIHKLPGSPQPPLSKDVPSLRRTKFSFHGDRLTTGPKSEGEISPTGKQEVQTKVRRRNSAIMYVESDDSEDDESLPKISTYANSFGQLTLGMGSRGAESIVISCILGPFLRRLVRCRSELVSQENLSLFGDIRQLFTYLREVHGSTFRRNMLVAMMCPIQRACERPRPKMPSTWSRMSTRNSMWLLPRQDKQRSNSIFSEAIVDDSTGVARGHRLTSWHNLLPRASLVGRGIRINSGSSSAAMMDRVLDTSHSRGDGESAAAQPLVEHRWVNAPALKEGLLEFSFLMECCEPGTILEPELVAALLDLDAPVVARACLLLECAAFVHRCNRGEWAGWMKFNLPSSFHHSAPSSHPTSVRPSPGTGVGSGASAGSGMNSDSSVSDIAALKRNAGRLFHAWGEPMYFNKLAYSNVSLMHVLLKLNFAASVNPTGDSCPYALLSAGVQLLLEITAYLREMHPRLPQPVTDEQASQPVRQPVGDQTSDGSLVAKRQHSYDPNVEKAGSFSKHLNSSPSRAGTSFRAARRRLSILMPIFGSGGSMNADEPEADAEQPALPGKLHS